MIGKLSELLQREGITSAKSLRAYIDNNYGKATGTFRILRKRDLGIDDENRIYDRTVEYENVIFDLAAINLSNSADINFSNCVFCGNIHIGEKEEDITITLLFMRCLCLGSITIGGLIGAEVNLDTTNATRLQITSSKLKKLDLLACRIGHLSIDDTRITQFDTFANSFELFELGACKFGEVKFDHSQIAIHHHTRLLNEKNRRKFFERNFQPFKFMLFPEIEDMHRQELRNRQATTMEFLLEHTNVHLDRGAFAQTKYLLALASQNNNLGLRLYQVLGAFIKPRRIIFLMLAVLLFYSIMFSLPCFSFNISDAKKDKPDVRSLRISEAFYFAGVTFTTVGYGDITPNGVARPFAVSEALAGVTLLSSFLVALTRKYVD